MLRRSSSVLTFALALFLQPLLGAAPASAATGYVTSDVAAIDVGDVPAGAKAARDITLTATTSVSYNGVGIGGMAPMEWAVTWDTCTGTIRAAAETCHITVEFTAGAEGVFHRDLSVSYNGPGSAYGLRIPLSATVPASTAVTVGDTISGPDATNNDYRVTGGPFRAAQAFTATQSGILTTASALVSAYDGCTDTSLCSGLPGLKVDLLADGPGATLATTTIPRASIPAGLGSTITARFTNPPHVVAGQRYLIALSASGATPPYSEYRWWASKTGGNQPYYVTSSSSSSWEQVLNGTPVRQASATIAVFTDTAAPVAVIDSQPAESTASTSASLAFHATDDRTGPGQLAYSCRLDGYPWAACASPASYPELAYGSHTFTVRATDEAGNTGTATTGWTVQDVPGAPTGLSATAGDHSATVSWTAAPANGSPVSGYTVTATPGGAEATVGGDVTTATMSGLTNGTAYTFTVHATNALGAGSLSAPSPPVTPAAVPDAPGQVTAVAGDRSATVSWTAAAANGAAVTGYTVTASPGGTSAVVDGSSTSAVVDGLANGTAYTFTVTAVNAIGPSPASAASSAVTPQDPNKPTVTSVTGPAAITRSTSAQFSFGATDVSDPAATLVYRCSLDGAAFSACASPTSYAGLGSTVHTFAVKAVDPSGNESATVSRTWRVDTTAPSLTVTAPTATFTLATSLVPAWATTDAAAGVAGADLRWQRAPFNGTFGAWVYPSSWQGTTATRATLAVSRGYTYCVSGRARDKAGNVSAWSAPRCTAVALDDRSLSASAGWSRTTSSAFYAGTATITSRSSVSLTRTAVQARRIALVATRCATCGTVGVYWNGVLVKKVSLYASSTQRRALIGVTSFTGVRSGTLTIRSLTSGKGIQIDGLALGRA